MMDSDLSTFELALLRTERDIADADDEMARVELRVGVRWSIQGLE